MKRRSNSRGFTLVELIIVLAIAALIIAGVFIAVTGAQRSRRDAQRKSDLTSLVAVITQFQSNHTIQPPDNAAAITTGMFDAKDPLKGARYTIKDSGDPAVGEISYLKGGACRTRANGGYTIVAISDPNAYAVNIGFESGDNYCLDSDNSDNQIAAPPTPVANGGTPATWLNPGSSISGCSPTPSNCMTGTGNAFTYWSPTGFNYTTSGVQSGNYTLTLDYSNIGSSPPPNYSYNVNIYVNGALVAANQQLPIKSDGTSSSPYYVNINVPSDNPSIKVEWTNDMASSTYDANFALNNLALNK